MKELQTLKELQPTSRMTLRKVTFNYLKNESELVAIPNGWAGRDENSEWTYKGSPARFIMSVENPFSTGNNPVLYLGTDENEYGELKAYLTNVLNNNK